MGFACVNNEMTKVMISYSFMPGAPKCRTELDHTVLFQSPTRAYYLQLANAGAKQDFLQNLQQFKMNWDKRRVGRWY